MADISKIKLPSGAEAFNIKDNSAFSDVSIDNQNQQKIVFTKRDGTSKELETPFLLNSLKGQQNGLAELDENGKVPSSQLPSYVDDVIEGYYINESQFSDTSYVNITGESGKIYIDIESGKTYRWSGSLFAEISASLALGSTSSTAFYGDKGQQAYDHAVTNKGISATEGLYKITTNSEGHIIKVTTVTKDDITNLGIPGTASTIDISIDPDNANRLLFSLG